MSVPTWLHNIFLALSHQSTYPLFFNTVLFAILFTILLIITIAVRQQNAVRIFILLAFSLFFYYKTSGWFVMLLSGTAAMDWLIGLGIPACKKAWQKNVLLYTSVVVNIGLLVYFKYTFFFTQTWFSIWGIEAPSLAWHIALPIGISFYTFKTLSYVIDVHREVIEQPERNYFHYLLYVSFFANILAGPITRATQFLHQLKTKFALTSEQASSALYLFAVGLFKKIVIADYLAANFTDRVLDTPGAFTGLENLLALYGYAIQLYSDFSGYTNMALAVALLLGFSIAGNFNEPFKATNISDFWRRWHITLSQWFNDYVFTPLYFSWRGWGKWGMALAVVCTFILSGLWHGPSFGFVLWGLAHGLAIAYETLTVSVRSKVAAKIPAWLYTSFSTLLTFHFLLLTYILFRTRNLPDALECANRIVNHFNGQLLGSWLQQYNIPAGILVLGLVLCFLPTALKTWARNIFVQMPWPLQALALALLIIVIYQSRTAGVQPFIYLQF